MDLLKELRGKNIGLYIRKEESGENLSTGYGRLQWLKYELEEHEGGLEVYIDEVRSISNLLKLIVDIESGYIKGVLLWSINDVVAHLADILAFECCEKEIPIVSFCENAKSTNEIIKNLIDESENRNSYPEYY